MYKHFMQINIRTSNSIENSTEDLNRHFSKEDIHTANKHMKRSSILLTVRETQIKTRGRMIKMDVVKNLQAINAGEDVKAREHFCIVFGNVN